MTTVIVTKGESSSNSFEKQIVGYLEKIDMLTSMDSVFQMDHYISFHNRVSKYSDKDIVDRLNNKVIVFYEVHNVRDVGNREKVESVYMLLLRVIKLCKMSKFILSSATPMVDSHYQMESIYKLLTSNSSRTGFVSFNSTVVEKPLAKYMGIPNDHVVPCIELVKMKGHQKLEYVKEESTSEVFDIYKKLTHITLFSFPDTRDFNSMTEVRTKFPYRNCGCCVYTPLVWSSNR